MTFELEHISTYSTHQGSINAILISPKNAIVTGGSDGVIAHRDINTGEITDRTIEGSPINSLSANWESSILASASDRKEVKIWNSTGLKTLETSTKVTSVTLSHDGKYVAASSGEDLFFWRVSDGKLLYKVKAALSGKPKGFTTIPYKITRLSFSSTEYTLTYFDENGSYYSFFNLDSILSGGWLKFGMFGSIKEIFMVEHWFFDKGEDKVKIYSLNDKGNRNTEPTIQRIRKAELGSFKHPLGGVITYSASGLQFHVQGNQNEFRYYEVTDKGVLERRIWHKSVIRSMICGDPYFLASADDTEIKIWDVLEGIELTSLGLINGKVNQLAFSNDAKYLTAALDNGNVVLWQFKQ